jgi:hypothetical protein
MVIEEFNTSDGRKLRDSRSKKLRGSRGDGMDHIPTPAEVSLLGITIPADSNGSPTISAAHDIFIEKMQATREPLSIEFQISDIDAQATLAKAEKIAKRTLDKGLSGGWTVALEKRVERNEETGTGGESTYLVITGTPCSYDGWEFIGIADFLEDEIIYRSIPGATEIPVVVKENYCDHCKTSRARHSLVVVKSADGEIKQLGSTCVKDFLGWDFSPTALPSEEEFDSLDTFRGGGVSGIDIVNFLAHVVATATEHGYVKAGNHGATAEIIWDAILGRDKASIEAMMEPSSDQIEQARELLKWGLALEGENDYLNHLRTALKLQFVYRQTKGIVGSVFKIWQNAQAKALEANIVYRNEIFAPVGTRVKLDVLVLDYSAIQGEYGTTILYQFASGDYKLKWFCTGMTDLDIGKTYTLKGTVKGFEEYRGQYATLLSRCRVVD